MSMQHWWNNNDRENLDYSRKNLSQSHCPPKIPHQLARLWNWDFWVTDKQLTTKAMTWPTLTKLHSTHYNEDYFPHPYIVVLCYGEYFQFSSSTRLQNIKSSRNFHNYKRIKFQTFINLSSTGILLAQWLQQHTMMWKYTERFRGTYHTSEWSKGQITSIW